MASVPTTIIDLGRLSLAHGEGTRLECPIRLERPLQLGAQDYEARPPSFAARLDVSRPTSGYAFRLRFPLRVVGPCARCLEEAVLETEIDVREVDQPGGEDEELRSPYVADEQLDVSRWAHDAAVLAMPARILCRSDCAGLCPVCGESLNDADPADHEHDTGPDPRWSKLDELRRE
jgi:uncharacterized protein